MMRLAAVALAAAVQISQFGLDPFEGLDELPVPVSPVAICRGLIVSDVPSAVEGGIIRQVGNTVIARFRQTRGFADGSQTLLMVQLDQQNPVTMPVEPGKLVVLYFSNLSAGDHRLVDLTLKRDASENISIYFGQTNCFTVKQEGAPKPTRSRTVR